MIETPEQLRDAVLSIIPDFQTQWEQGDNLWKEEDGSFSFHGLFTALDWYVRDSFQQISELTRIELMFFIESCLLEIDDTSHDSLDNAACTCFLENLSCESISEELRTYMGPKSKAFFDYWN